MASEECAMEPSAKKIKTKYNGPVTVYRIIKIPREVLSQDISSDFSEAEGGCVFEIGDNIEAELLSTNPGNHKDVLKTIKIRRKSDGASESLSKTIARLDDDKTCVCTICFKSFRHKSHLKRHVNSHTAERRYRCDMCEKSFLDLSTVSRHRKTHTGEKPWACQVCGKCFATLGSLRRHMTVHNQEGRPYHCQTCDKRFPDNSSFRKHLLIHTGIKPHVCEVCEKAFVHIGDLNGHKKIHVEVKPFKCDLCGKDFAKHSNFARHLTIHEGAKEFVCNLCGVSYNYQGSLTRHLLTHVRKNKPKKSDLGEHLDTSGNKKTMSIKEIRQLRRDLKKMSKQKEKEMQQKQVDVDGGAEVTEVRRSTRSRKPKVLLTKTTRSQSKKLAAKQKLHRKSSQVTNSESEAQGADSQTHYTEGVWVDPDTLLRDSAEDRVTEQNAGTATREGGNTEVTETDDKVAKTIEGNASVEQTAHEKPVPSREIRGDDLSGTCVAETVGSTLSTGGDDTQNINTPFAGTSTVEPVSSEWVETGGMITNNASNSAGDYTVSERNSQVTCMEVCKQSQKAVELFSDECLDGNDRSANRCSEKCPREEKQKLTSTSESTNTAEKECNNSGNQEHYNVDVVSMSGEELVRNKTDSVDPHENGAEIQVCKVKSEDAVSTNTEGECFGINESDKKIDSVSAPVVETNLSQEYSVEDSRNTEQPKTYFGITVIEASGNKCITVDQAVKEISKQDLTRGVLRNTCDTHVAAEVRSVSKNVGETHLRQTGTTVELGHHIESSSNSQHSSSSFSNTGAGLLQSGSSDSECRTSTSQHATGQNANHLHVAQNKPGYHTVCSQDSVDNTVSEVHTARKPSRCLESYENGEDVEVHEISEDLGNEVEVLFEVHEITDLSDEDTETTGGRVIKVLVNDSEVIELSDNGETDGTVLPSDDHHIAEMVGDSISPVLHIGRTFDVVSEEVVTLPEEIENQAEDSGPGSQADIEILDL